MVLNAAIALPQISHDGSIQGLNNFESYASVGFTDLFNLNVSIFLFLLSPNPLLHLGKTWNVFHCVISCCSWYKRCLLSLSTRILDCKC